MHDTQQEEHEMSAGSLPHALLIPMFRISSLRMRACLRAIRCGRCPMQDVVHVHTCFV